MKPPTDDRGVPCTIATLSPKQIGWRALGLPSVTPDPLTKHEQGATAVGETVVALVGGLLGYTIWQFTAGALLRPVIGVLLDLVAGSSFAVIIAMVFWWFGLGWVRRRRFPRIAEIYLGQGHCASCGYRLDGLTPEGDGCFVCPECSAAWRADRVSSLREDHDQPS